MFTELHRHLDVSVRTSTLLELAQARGLEAQSTSLEAFREKLIMRQPMQDLTTVLAQFTLFQHVLDLPEVLERVACEALEDCRQEGTRQVEFRFSPSFVCEFSHLAWEDALDGFHKGLQKGLQKFPDMRAGLICIATRGYGTDSVDQSVEFFLKHQDRFVGFDLAGDERDYPARRFEKSFRKLRDANAKITVHAGEDSGPESIWEAIEDLGARRIGHGIACEKDPELMKYLAEKEICLEMCPTSNWLTGCVKDLRDHPLPRVLRAGIPVCINTDDPGIFGVTLPGEVEICKKSMGMSDQEIQRTMDNARRYSFIV